MNKIITNLEVKFIDVIREYQITSNKFKLNNFQKKLKDIFRMHYIDWKIFRMYFAVLRMFFHNHGEVYNECCLHYDKQYK